MPSKLWVPALALTAALLGALAAQYWLGSGKSAQGTLQSGTLLPNPRPVADFALTAEDGKPFTRAQLDGRWSLIFVGFTRCPDVCPTTLSTLKSVAGRLADQGKSLQVIFLSVDPERDTPEALERYVHY